MVTLPAEIAALLPKDCCAILYVPSARDARTQLAPLMTATGESKFDPHEPIREHPYADYLLNAGLVIETRPYVIAFSIQQGGMPRPVSTILVPVENAEDLVAATPDMKMMAPAIAAPGYILLSDLPNNVPRGIEPVTFPAGLYSVHCDLAALVLATRPLIEMGLAGLESGMIGGAPGINPEMGQELAAAYVTPIRKFLDSANTFAAGLVHSSGGYELHAALTVRDGSPLARTSTKKGEDLWEIAGTVDPKAPFAVVLGGDAAEGFNLTRPLWGAALSMYPPALSVKLRMWMDEFMPVIERLDGAFSMSGGFGPGGMEVATYGTVSKEKKFLEEYLALLSESPVQGEGVDLSEPTVRESGKAKVYDFTTEYDFEKLLGAEGMPGASTEEAERMMRAVYGDEGLRMSLAAHDGIFAFFMGRDRAAVDAAIETMHQSPSILDDEMQLAIARVNRAPMAMAGQVDITAFLRSVGQMQAATTGQRQDRDLSALQSVGPTTLYGWGSVERNTWTLGLSLPAQSVANLLMLESAMKSSGGF